MIDLKDYRSALGSFPTGVTIVTAPDGTAWQAAPAACLFWLARQHSCSVRSTRASTPSIRKFSWDWWKATRITPLPHLLIVAAVSLLPHGRRSLHDGFIDLPRRA